MDPLLEELERTWHQGIPITAAMQVRAVSYADARLVIEAALAPNINVHHTAFAGSLYAVCALGGWSLLWLALKQRGLDGSILLAEGQIRYTKPVTTALRCHCELAAEQQQALERAIESGKGVFEIASAIDGAQAAAVTFRGRYALRL